MFFSRLDNMLIYVFAICYVLMYICNGGFTCYWKSCDWMVCSVNYLAGVNCYLMELFFYFSIRFCIAALLHTHTEQMILGLFFPISYNIVRHVYIVFICVLVACIIDRVNTLKPNLLNIWSYYCVKISSVPFKQFLEWGIFF